MLAARAGESICSFARAFARRSVDPWILRATYEELVASRGFPPRADDRLSEDLAFDPDDLVDAFLAIAGRAGRSLESTSSNPYSGRVTTIRELVLFLHHQPVLAASRASRGVSGTRGM